jgi:hypothetical protein
LFAPHTITALNGLWMETTLRHLVQNRAEIKSLLHNSSNYSHLSSNSFTPLHWISPHELHLPLVPYEDLEENSNANELDSLIQLHQEIFALKILLGKKNLKKILMKFESIDIPESAPPRPLLSDVRTRIESGLLNFGIYSSNGYNFGLEYNHIYNGETMPGLYRFSFLLDHHFFSFHRNQI